MRCYIDDKNTFGLVVIIFYTFIIIINFKYIQIDSIIIFVNY